MRGVAIGPGPNHGGARGGACGPERGEGRGWAGGGGGRWTFPPQNKMPLPAGAPAGDGPATRRNCPECGGLGYVLVRGLSPDACLRCAREAEAAWLWLRQAPAGARRAA